MVPSELNYGGLLRGTLAAADVARILHKNITTNTPPSYLRDDYDQTHSSGDSAVDDNNDSKTREDYLVNIFSAVIVILAAGLLLCICQVLLHLSIQRFTRNDVVLSDDQSLFVDEGRVLQLNPQQRRAVLEAILSETSKAVTGEEIYTSKLKKKQRIDKSFDSDDTLDDDDSSLDVIPANVKIPMKSITTESIGTDNPSGGDDMSNPPATPLARCLFLDSGSDANNSSSAELHQKLPIARTRSSSSLDKTSGSGPNSAGLSPAMSVPTPQRGNTTETFRTDSSDRNNDDLLFENLPIFDCSSTGSFNNETQQDGDIPTTRLERRQVLRDDDDDDDDDDGDSELKSPKLQVRTTISNGEGDVNKNVVVGGDDEECKEEEEEEPDSKPTALEKTVVQIRRESYAQSVTTISDYTFDSQTEGILCSICLCSYAEGDMVIGAKYCSHMFHKDCILEWLEKRDECPVCRVNMVTNRDINKVATSVVGDNIAQQIQRTPVPGLRTPGSISRMTVEGPVSSSFQPSYAGFSGHNHPLSSRGTSTSTRTQQRQQQQQQQHHQQTATTTTTVGVSLLSLTASSSQDNSNNDTSTMLRRVGSAPLERRIPRRIRQDSGVRVYNTSL